MMPVPALTRFLGFLLAAASAVAVALACSGDTKGGGGLAGTTCDPECAGLACNSRCEFEVIYWCPPSGRWEVETNCAATGKTCDLVVPDPAEAYGEVVCVDRAADGGAGAPSTGGRAGRGGEGGSAATGGAGAWGGAGGTGGASGGSPGTVTIEFSVEDRGAYCKDDDGCSAGPAISISAPGDAPLILSGGWCPTLCSDCTPQPCPGAECSPSGVPVEGSTITWDASYFERGICGADTPCLSPRFAPAGVYEARFCAQRGTIQGDPSQSECVETGPPECAVVRFELPDGTVAETLPGNGMGGSASVDAGAPDPICSSADSQGLFPSCASCPTADCDTVDSPSGGGSACGCSTSADCPCGLRCGCLDIAPGVGVCSICVR